jgi:hypothetical protein
MMNEIMFEGFMNTLEKHGLDRTQERGGYKLARANSGRLIQALMKLSAPALMTKATKAMGGSLMERIKQLSSKTKKVVEPIKPGSHFERMSKATGRM